MAELRDAARPRGGRAPADTRPRRGRALVAIACLCLAACSRGVEVSPAPHTAECTPATRHWPRQVHGQDGVRTTSDSPSVRAWGEPAIVARCGVDALGPTANQCIAVDDVDWVAERLDDGTRFTTYGRSPALEVLVPSAYDPAPLVLPAFREVARSLPVNGRRCQ